VVALSGHHALVLPSKAIKSKGPPILDCFGQRLIQNHEFNI